MQASDILKRLLTDIRKLPKKFLIEIRMSYVGAFRNGNPSPPWLRPELA